MSAAATPPTACVKKCLLYCLLLLIIILLQTISKTYICVFHSIARQLVPLNVTHWAFTINGTSAKVQTLAPPPSDLPVHHVHKSEIKMCGVFFFLLLSCCQQSPEGSLEGRAKFEKEKKPRNETNKRCECGALSFLFFIPLHSECRYWRQSPFPHLHTHTHTNRLKKTLGDDRLQFTHSCTSHNRSYMGPISCTHV